MAFSLKTSSCVAVGTFNIYIIQPEWLTRIGLIPSNTEIEIESNFHRPGFRFTVPGLTWVVFPGQLAIETALPNSDCGGPMAQVLDNLRWTPVFGLGNNVKLSAKRDEIHMFPALERLLAMPNATQGLGKEESRAFGVTIRRDEEKKFNIGVSLKDDTVELIGNAHLELRADGRTTERAVTEAKASSADIEALLTLFSDVFGVQSDDISNRKP